MASPRRSQTPVRQQETNTQVAPLEEKRHHRQTKKCSSSSCSQGLSWNPPALPLEAIHGHHWHHSGGNRRDTRAKQPSKSLSMQVVREYWGGPPLGVQILQTFPTPKTGMKQIEQFNDIILRILRFLAESSGVTKLELFQRFPHCESGFSRCTDSARLRQDSAAKDIKTGTKLC